MYGVQDQKNQLTNFWLKRAIRTIFFVKLYEKDESTGIYKYGHTKSTLTLMEFSQYIT